MTSTEGLLAAIILLGGVAVEADTLFYDSAQISVSLLDTPCGSEAMKEMLYGVLLADAKTAILRFEGKVMKGCWQATEDDVYLVDEAGHRGIVPIGVFRKASPMVLRLTL